MSAAPDRWRSAYRPLRPASLAVQLVLLVAAELALYASYDVHDARFHWATHFLVGLACASLVLLGRLLLTGAPGPRLLLPTVLAFHLFAMLPDLLFRAGVPHHRWMDVFLGHVAAHYLPGGTAAGWSSRCSAWARTSPPCRPGSGHGARRPQPGCRPGSA